MRASAKLAIIAAATAAIFSPAGHGALARGHAAAGAHGAHARVVVTGGGLHLVTTGFPTARGFVAFQTQPSLALTRQMILNHGFFLPSTSPFGPFGTGFGAFPSTVGFGGGFGGGFWGGGLLDGGFGVGGAVQTAALPNVVVIAPGAGGTLPLGGARAPQDDKMTVETTASGVQIVRGPGTQH